MRKVCVCLFVFVDQVFLLRSTGQIIWKQQAPLLFPMNVSARSVGQLADTVVVMW